MNDICRTLIGFTALLALILTGCSNSPDSFSTAGSTDIEQPGDSGPIDGGDQADSLFTFDESTDSEIRQTTRTIPGSGGDLTLYFNGDYRTLTFPARPAGADWDVSVTITKGYNLYGDNLEVYEFEPSEVAYVGAIGLAIESGVPNRNYAPRDVTFSLYRSIAEQYSLYSTAIPNSSTIVEFTLNSSTKFAVIYEQFDKEPDINLN